MELTNNMTCTCHDPAVFGHIDRNCRRETQNGYDRGGRPPGTATEAANRVIADFEAIRQRISEAALKLAATSANWPELAHIIQNTGKPPETSGNQGKP